MFKEKKTGMALFSESDLHILRLREYNRQFRNTYCGLEKAKFSMKAEFIITQEAVLGESRLYKLVSWLICVLLISSIFSYEFPVDDL